MYGFIIILFFIGLLAAAAAGVFFYFKNRRSGMVLAAREAEIRKECEKKIEEYKASLEHGGKETSRRMYELAILKELGERIGYSLDIQNIVDIITGSLHQFIKYSEVSYMLLGGE